MSIRSTIRIPDILMKMCTNMLQKTPCSLPIWSPKQSSVFRLFIQYAFVVWSGTNLGLLGQNHSSWIPILSTLHTVTGSLLLWATCWHKQDQNAIIDYYQDDNLQDDNLQHENNWLFRVATALLVAGPALTLWYLGRLCLHPPACTQALFKVCQYRGSFQLMHCSSQGTQ